MRTTTPPRFVVLAREPLDPATLAGAPAMTTFVFEVKNIPAALYKALGGFATNGVNMTKLESYQQRRELLGDDVLSPTSSARLAIRRSTARSRSWRSTSKELRMLGSYPQALRARLGRLHVRRA